MKNQSYCCEYVNENLIESSLKCILCKRPLSEPWTHILCEKLFCRKCIEEANFVCSNCPNSNKFEFFEVKVSGLINSLNELFVICTLCGKQMKRIEFENAHKSSCQNATLSKTKETAKIPNNSQENSFEMIHKRKFSEFSNENQINDLVNCGLGCGEEIHFSRESQHLAVCPEKNVKCEASCYGCTQSFKRKCVKEHAGQCDFVKALRFFEGFDPKMNDFFEKILKMEEEKTENKKGYPFISSFLNKIKKEMKYTKKLVLKKMKNYYDSLNNGK